MGNSVFNAMGGQQGGMHPFVQFMQQMRGKDPNQMIQQLVQQHGITQEQMNGIQQKAQAMAGQLEQFRGMFGF